MTKNDTPKLPSEALHPFTARDVETGKTYFAYAKAEVDRYLLYYKDAVEIREKALQDEIARLRTGSGSERLWLVNYVAILANGSKRIGHLALHSEKSGESLMKEAYEACESKNPPETEIVLCGMSDLGYGVEPANTYSDVVNREG